VTIQDIAAEAGVSTATVSRVLNNKAVRIDSLEKVEAAIKKLNFIPNAFARGLMSKRSKAIGTLITSMTNSYYMEITEVIEKRIKDDGSMLLLCSTDGTYKSEKAYLQDLVSRQVDGIIIIDPSIENYTNGFFRSIAERVPLILVHSWTQFSGFNSVYIDQLFGMNQVMNYLWNLGHRRIAFIRGASKSHSYDLKEHLWEEFLVSRGTKNSRDFFVSIPEGNTEEAVQLAHDACIPLLSLPESKRPSAIFACNDLMALGVFSAAHEIGIKIPEEISIVGHDNTLLAFNSYPPMTTVNMKMRSLGNAAVDLLTHALNPEDPEPRKILISPELVIRNSAGPCIEQTGIQESTAVVSRIIL
jgi:LacI family transcriptional regulator